MKHRSSGDFVVTAKRQTTGVIEIRVKLGKYPLYTLSILDVVWRKAKDSYQKYKLMEVLFSFVVDQIDAQTVRLAESAVKAIEKSEDECR